jgi:hypothetical protein
MKLKDMLRGTSAIKQTHVSGIFLRSPLGGVFGYVAI